jgi:hypothetical protein
VNSRRLLEYIALKNIYVTISKEKGKVSHELIFEARDKSINSK